eukprot:5743546-Pleurochrysis_carterae.AAC.1
MACSAACVAVSDRDGRDHLEETNDEEIKVGKLLDGVQQLEKRQLRACIKAASEETSVWMIDSSRKNKVRGYLELRDAKPPSDASRTRPVLWKT